MKKRFNLISTILLILFSLTGIAPPVPAADAPDAPTNLTVMQVSGDCVENPSETFVAGDAPENRTVSGSYLFRTPWGYNKQSNATRIYPTVVIGCWNEERFFTEDVKKKYPAFYYIFNHCNSESQGVDMANAIDAAIGEGLRIDTNRIYLTGFSKGGSGGYKIIRGYHSAGKLLAAFIRIAGGSQSTLPDEIVEKISIWYHIGLMDSQGRINTANAAYAFIKNHAHNSSAVETSNSDNITGYNRTTKTLSKGDIEIMKLSKYEGMGHTPGPPYSDPYLFDWLFKQSLQCR